jgi:hypothetical protein
MAASFEQLSKITGFNQCFEKVNLSFLAMKGDWVKHCLSVYPKMSEEAISLAWSRTFPTSTVLRAVLRAESKAYLYFFVRKQKGQEKLIELNYSNTDAKQKKLAEEQARLKRIVRDLLYELAEVDSSVEVIGKDLLGLISSMASPEDLEDIAGALGTLAASLLGKKALPHYSELRRYVLQGSFSSNIKLLTQTSVFWHCTVG